MANKEKKGGFLAWYESYQGKRVTGIVYSVGAAVVIIGALFKILHWPGASAVLMIGMFTEAFLFTIGVLDAPHPEFHWEQVFPQLVSLESGCEPNLYAEISQREKPTLLGTNGPAGNGGGVGIPSANLSDKDQDSLSEGIQKLAKTAAQLNDLGKVAEGTAKLGEKMEVAGVAMEKFAASATNMSGQTEAYEKGLNAVNANLNNLNAVYELQLKNVQAQAEALKLQADKTNAATAQVELISEDMKKAAAATSAAVKSSEAFEAASKQLAAQVADLNKVYGNMLNALA
ncbi:MAG: gliding motility protein GldL [Paludibacteraceae bacterium]|nr:gliding motility protein GldL [Paludibacteraceae bacterium]MBO4578417.1 gliding motility protein GldL [Paludibacteraceae bacterium]